MSDVTICTCGQGYDPECPWEAHHQQELVKRPEGLPIVNDKAGWMGKAEAYMNQCDRDIKTLWEIVEAYHLDHDDEVHHMVPPRDRCECEICERLVVLKEVSGE